MSADAVTPITAKPFDTEVTTLRVHRAGRTDVPLTAAVLGQGGWLGERVANDELPAGTVRYLTDLVFPLPPDGRLLSLRKAAYVDLGPVEALAEDHVEVAIAWRSSSLAPLFPVFAGRLIIRATGMGLEGHYAPPGGVVGRAADRMLLNTAARGTARWFLDHLATKVRTGAEAGGVF